MAVESIYITAFLVGLLGGVHCLGMCGGIVAALSLGIDDRSQQKVRTKAVILIGYNFGRIISYSLMGVIAGLLGSLALDLTGLQQIRIVLHFLSVAIMLALGLYLAGWWFGLNHLERIGLSVWRFIEPLGKKLIPVKNFVGALFLGAVWGWLPCGLVYSILIWSITSASPMDGGLMMLSFGLGTLPNLLLMGGFAAELGVFVKKPFVRRLAGLIVIGLACWQLYIAVNVVMGVDCWYCTSG